MTSQAHPCPNCNDLRNCRVLFDVETPGNRGLVFHSVQHMTMQCNGCGTVFFHIKRNPTHKIFSSFGGEYYPKVDIVNSALPIGMLLKEDTACIYSLYIEVASAINAHLCQLAVAGMRTLIDRIAMNLTGSNGGFAQNLRMLLDKNYISGTQHSQLEIIIDAGGGVVHRNHTPEIENAVACFDVVTSLIKTQYVYPEVMQKVLEKTPQREK